MNEDEWLDLNMEDLVDEYTSMFPEDFPDEESLMDCENNGEFQAWANTKYAEYEEE